MSKNVIIPFLTSVGVLMSTLLFKIDLPSDFDQNNPITFDNSFVSPISLGDELTISGSFRVNLATYNEASFSVHIYRSNYMSSNISYYDLNIYNHVKLEKWKTYSYSFDVYNAKNYASQHLKVEYVVKDHRSNTEIAKTYFYVNVKEKSVINPFAYKSKEFKSKDMYCQNGNIVNEYFQFDGILDEIILDRYYIFSLESLYFRYRNTFNQDFPYENAIVQIAFSDPNNYYPLLQNANGTVSLNGSLYQDNDVWRVRFDNLYVNRSSLKMRLGYSPGFVSTKYLFLPKNKRAEIEDYSFFIRFSNLGLNEYTFQFYFKIASYSLLIGPCDISDYCVIGGIEA